MPVLFQDPDKKKREEGEQQRTNTQVLGGESRGALGGGTSGTSPSGGTRSGSFTNLQSYLKAAEGQDFGGEVAGRVRGALGEGAKARAGEREKFGQDVAKGTTKYDEGFVTGVLDKPVGIDEDTKKRFASYLGAEYTGPKEYEYDPSSQAGRTFEKGQKYAEFAATPEKRSTLLGELYERPQGYTSGQRNLDTLIMGQAPQGTFAGLGEQAAGQREQLEQFMGYADPETGEWVPGSSELAANAAAAETANTATQTRTALGVDEAGNIIEGTGALGGLREDIQSQLSDEMTRRGDVRSALEQGFASRELTPEQYQMLSGLGKGGKTWGLDLRDFMEYSADPSLSAMASPDQVARMQALEGLGGIESGYLDPSAAGQYDPQDYASFDPENRFGGLVGQRKRAYEAALDEPMSEDFTRQLGIAPGATLNQLLSEISQIKNDPNFQNKSADWKRQVQDMSRQANAALDRLRGKHSFYSTLK